MADNAAPVEDDLSLPRAGVNKMIKEVIPMIRVSNDARELVLNCCTEFIHLIASEANEICNKQTKKTISPEHVIQALESLGFHDYIKDVEGVYEQFKKQSQTRKKNNKLKNQGVSEEELLRQQQALIAQARAEQAQEEWMHMQQAQQQMMMQQQQQQQTSTSQQPPSHLPLPSHTQTTPGSGPTTPLHKSEDGKSPLLAGGLGPTSLLQGSSTSMGFPNGDPGSPMDVGSTSRTPTTDNSRMMDVTKPRDSSMEKT